MDNVIYSYGGGEALQTVFNALAICFSSSGIVAAFVLIGGFMGFMQSMGSAAIKNMPTELLKYFLWYGAISTIALSVKTPLWVDDIVEKRIYKIDNVPIILSLPISYISKIGYVTTEEMEKTFNVPGDLQYSKTGRIFGSELMSDLGFFTIKDRRFRKNIHRLTNNCIIMDGLIGHRYTMDDLSKTKDIWQFYKNTASEALGFFYIDKETKLADLVTCKEGINKMEAEWGDIIKESAKYYGKRYFPHNKNEQAAKTAFLSALPIAYQNFTNMSEDASSLLKQTMMINALRAAPQEKLMELGSTNYAVAKSTLQQRSTFQISGEMAKKLLPAMKVVFEALIYGSFVFVMILATLPEGWRVLMTYFGLVLWLQVWPPMYAILNMVMNLYSKVKTSNILDSTGLNDGNILEVISANADIASKAGFLSMSIPFISYAVIKGGASSFVHLATHLGGVTQAASSAAGSEISSGNLSFANVSSGNWNYDNHSAFHQNTAATNRSGFIETQGADGQIRNIYGNSSPVIKGGSKISQLPTSLRASDTYQESINEGLTHHTNMAKQYANEYSEHMSQAERETADFIERQAKSIASGEGHTIDTSTSEGKSLASMAENAASYMKSHSFDGKLEMNGNISAGGTKHSFSIFDRVLPYSSSLSASSSASRGESIGDNEANSDRLSMNGVLDTYSRYAKSHSLNESTSNDDSYSENNSTSFEKAQTARESENISLQKAEGYQHAINNSSSSTIGSDEDLTQELMDYVAERNHNDSDKAFRILSTSSQERDDYINEFKDLKKSQFKNSIEADIESSLQSSYQEQSSESRFYSNNQSSLREDFESAKQDIKPQSFDGTVNTMTKDIANKHIEVGHQKVAAQEQALNEQRAKTKYHYDKEESKTIPRKLAESAGKGVASTFKEGSKNIKEYFGFDKESNKEDN